ncbi:hypothetical protein TSOC_002017 [Tetrabaena socialis]|uniref:Uncharacterized protein n=1 Tax=Tetrabaena socialis TaxID=47790 RepID=A0A2J8AF69_9CHLO|nr:hypothetical protein TSOC_002017 [Tetrabaena socialis]|eukprot:PNH11165.1 hypothetical protein TSOC_002017 [Tetrabaena socialis]
MLTIVVTVDVMLGLPAVVYRDFARLHSLLLNVLGFLQQFPRPAGAGTAESAAAAATVLADDAFRATLLRLVAAVVSDGGGRDAGGSSDSSGGGGSAGSNSRASGGGACSPELTLIHETLAPTVCVLNNELLQMLNGRPHVSRATTDFIQKLLRMQTLQCIAREFAAATASVGALTAWQIRDTDRLGGVLHCLLFVVSGGSEEKGLEHAHMRRELAEALRVSGVLEHAARLVLLQLHAAPTGEALSASESVANLAHHFAAVYNKTGRMLMQYMREGGDAVAAAALREVLSGRCARHAALVHGVAALCRADGGPSYGLPEDVLRMATVMASASFGAGLKLYVQLDAAVPVALMMAAGLASPTPPVGVQATVLLLLRLAAWRWCRAA